MKGEDDRRAGWQSRVLLAVVALVALAFGGVWWLATGLAADSYDSACADSLAADISFGAAFGGVAAALVALVAGIPGAVRAGWWSLVVYAALFAVSAPLFLGCE